MKRIFLSGATNIAILLVLSVTCACSASTASSTTGHRARPNALLIFSAVLGFGGSLISLAMSKWIAKRIMGVHVIDQPRDASESVAGRNRARQAQAPASACRKSASSNRPT